MTESGGEALYLQEERQDGHEGVGAAGQQRQGSATVHPQRVIPGRGHQPVLTHRKHWSVSPPAGGGGKHSSSIYSANNINGPQASGGR